MAAVPSNLRSWQNRPGTPLVDSASSNAPITPTHKVEWESFLHDASSPQPNTVEHPQDAPTANGDNFLTLPVMRYSSETSATRSTSDRKANNTPGLTLNLSANNESLSPSHTRDDRWSWTNSQAPSTPRIAAPNRRSSLASTRIRNVASWVRNQGRPSDEAKIVKGKKSKPLLKNQAVKPVLAPQAESHVKRSKSSGKHRRVGSLSMIFKPNSPLGAPGPLSPRLEEQRNLKGEAEL
ncbi:Hypothetical predicted protein [Lecanosticta acicola]|uniref:Uncharacterized protein n=1 Tax=Lecanosticta acicola TaxID=111012 RepID=A0AAI8Z430_9PEZI|nr:Hypothetical predicted protein [Lecanosticta acicola]